jgi:hypothetical protein
VIFILPALSYDAQTLKELSPRCGSVGYYESVAISHSQFIPPIRWYGINHKRSGSDFGEKNVAVIYQARYVNPSNSHSLNVKRVPTLVDYTSVGYYESVAISHSQFIPPIRWYGINHKRRKNKSSNSKYISRVQRRHRIRSYTGNER